MALNTADGLRTEMPAAAIPAVEPPVLPVVGCCSGSNFPLSIPSPSPVPLSLLAVDFVDEEYGFTINADSVVDRGPRESVSTAP